MDISVESIAVRQHFTTAGCQSQGDLQQKLGYTIQKHEKSTCHTTDAFLGNYAEIWRWKSSMSIVSCHVSIITQQNAFVKPFHIIFMLGGGRRWVYRNTAS